MPFLICWPARIKGGKVNSTSVVTALDLFPTLCKLAGVKPQTNGYQLDGMDISDILLGKTSKKRKTPMYWEFGQQFVGKEKPQNAYQFRSPNIAVRDGKWKLLVNYDGSDVELYDIERDEKETTNMAATHTGIALHMKKMAIDWYNASFRKHAGELRND
jgi:arylsulfatase A-like enzyme